MPLYLFVHWTLNVDEEENYIDSADQSNLAETLQAGLTICPFRNGFLEPILQGQKSEKLNISIQR